MDYPKDLRRAKRILQKYYEEAATETPEDISATQMNFSDIAKLMVSRMSMLDKKIKELEVKKLKPLKQKVRQLQRKVGYLVTITANNGLTLLVHRLEISLRNSGTIPGAKNFGGVLQKFSNNMPAFGEKVLAVLGECFQVDKADEENEKKQVAHLVAFLVSRRNQQVHYSSDNLDEDEMKELFAVFSEKIFDSLMIEKPEKKTLMLKLVKAVCDAPIYPKKKRVISESVESNSQLPRKENGMKRKAEASSSKTSEEGAKQEQRKKMKK